MRVAIVAEGPSDLILLERLVREIHPSSEVVRVQPEATLGSFGSGWTGVRAWCNEFRDSLEDFLTLDDERPIDRLIVHVDCSMAHNVNAQRPCPPASTTADALRDVVLRDWLQLQAQPEWLILATPSTSTDTWLAAAIDPEFDEHLECVAADRIEGRLIARRVFRRKTNGRVAKPPRLYDAAVGDVVARLGELRSRCSEADRLCVELT